MNDTAPEPSAPIEGEPIEFQDGDPFEPPLEPEPAVASPDRDEENRIFAACQAKQDEIAAGEAGVQTLRDELAELHNELQTLQEKIKATTPPPAPFRDERSN